MTPERRQADRGDLGPENRGRGRVMAVPVNTGSGGGSRIPGVMPVRRRGLDLGRGGFDRVSVGLAAADKAVEGRRRQQRRSQADGHQAVQLAPPCPPSPHAVAIAAGSGGGNALYCYDLTGRPTWTVARENPTHGGVTAYQPGRTHTSRAALAAQIGLQMADSTLLVSNSPFSSAVASMPR